MAKRSKATFLILILAGMVTAIVAVPAFSHQDPNQEKKDPALTVTCTADPTAAPQGVEGSVITVTTNVEQKVESTLKYTWSVTGGAKITGSDTDSVVTIDTAGLRQGLYIVKVKVDDEHKNTATCRATFSITPGQPNNTPDNKKDCATATLTATPQIIETGGASNVTLHVTTNFAEASSLKYQWNTDKGKIEGDGDTVTLDTATLDAGMITVKMTVTDGKCAASSITTITKK